MVSLFKVAGIEVKQDGELDTKQLIGQELTIEIGERSYNDPEMGNERTLKQAMNYVVS